MFRLAVAQAPAALQTPEDRLEWLHGVMPEVAGGGADLVLLPELFVCGYNIGDAVRDRAEPLAGPTSRKIAELARQHGVAIHYGFAEQADGHLFNAATCVSPEGRHLVHQRKLAIPPGPERQYFQQGSGCELFEYHGLRIATLICYDAEFPETGRAVAGKGAELLLVPTALGARWAWVATTLIPARAYENGIFLAYANSAGTENGMEFLGQSFIAAPDGIELARAGNEVEILFADIDRARVSAAQSRLPYLRDRIALGELQ
ncbi:carbon-nitrogen hydrolase family protein [Ovoidimarina sediminis]|uniref:carbon-nitrogen hydrolase family protein n=1 Tax=Ovoidimarina sediminis TaxID=3079856 RepID=UPI0029060B8B|nr:carbon-nitrogen hydrolase family protein [Rhodophyticola sp. MJ-SS7]MDU8945922.1 carbon-nitrogen hydrolase family protein [Rhodophyticola sp. MJ-SS7]